MFYRYDKKRQKHAHQALILILCAIKHKKATLKNISARQKVLQL